MYLHYESLTGDPNGEYFFSPDEPGSGFKAWKTQAWRDIFQAFAGGQVLFANALYSVERPDPLQPSPTQPGGTTPGDGPGGTQILPDGIYPLPDGSAYLPPPVATISVGQPTVTFEP